MKTGTAAYLGITTGLSTPGLVKIVALFPDLTETFGLKNFDQPLIRKRAKPWHASMEAGESCAAR